VSRRIAIGNSNYRITEAESKKAEGDALEIAKLYKPSAVLSDPFLNS